MIYPKQKFHLKHDWSFGTLFIDFCEKQSQKDKYSFLCCMSIVGCDGYQTSLNICLVQALSVGYVLFYFVWCLVGQKCIGGQEEAGRVLVPLLLDQLLGSRCRETTSIFLMGGHEGVVLVTFGEGKQRMTTYQCNPSIVSWAWGHRKTFVLGMFRFWELFLKLDFFIWRHMGENSSVGWPLARCSLCKNDEKLTNYFHVHCVIGWQLLDSVFLLFDICWVLPCSIKELLLGWHRMLVGEIQKGCGGLCPSAWCCEYNKDTFDQVKIGRWCWTPFSIYLVPMGHLCFLVATIASVLFIYAFISLIVYEGNKMLL